MICMTGMFLPVESGWGLGMHAHFVPAELVLR